MVNAGRVLIIPKGTWSNLVTYEMLDLVTAGDIAYIAKQASVGQDPTQDTSMTYWQPFGTAAKIATTSEPGLVMPDGTTITIDNTGLISVILGITGLTDVVITSLSNGQILQYDGSTSKWKNVSLGSAALRNATSSITSGSTDLIESGAVNSLKQTLETALANKVSSSDIANNLTTTTAGKVLDARQGKNLADKMKWTLLNSAVGMTPIILPSEFNELLIHVTTGSVWVNFTINISRAMLKTSDQYFSAGSYFSSTSHNGCIFRASLSEIALNTVSDSTGNVTSTSSIYVYYK